MKRIIPLAILVFGLFGTIGCAEFGGAFVAGLPKVGIGSPFAGQMGLTPRGVAVLITNAKTVDGLVFVYGKEMGVVKPGTTASFEKFFEPLVNQRIEIPFTVFFADGEGKVASVAQRKFSTQSSDDNQRTESWIIGENDGWAISSVGGGGALVTGPGVNRVKMPREFWSGSLAIQMVNDSKFKVLLRVRHGGNTGEFPVRWQRGRFSYSVFRGGLAKETEQILFLVVLKDPETDRIMGIHKIEIWIPQEGIAAEQWVVTDHGVDRR